MRDMSFDSNKVEEFKALGADTAITDQYGIKRFRDGAICSIPVSNVNEEVNKFVPVKCDSVQDLKVGDKIKYQSVAEILSRGRSDGYGYISIGGGHTRQLIINMLGIANSEITVGKLFQKGDDLSELFRKQIDGEIGRFDPWVSTFENKKYGGNFYRGNTWTKSWGEYPVCREPLALAVQSFPYSMSTVEHYEYGYREGSIPFFIANDHFKSGIDIIESVSRRDNSRSEAIKNAYREIEALKEARLK